MFNLFQKHKRNKEIIQVFIDLVEGRIPLDIFWEKYAKEADVVNFLDKTYNKKIMGLFRKEEWLSYDINYFFDRACIKSSVSSFLRIKKIKHSLVDKDVDYVNGLFNSLPEWVDWLPIEYMHNLYLQAPPQFTDLQKMGWFTSEIIRLFRYKDSPPEWLPRGEWPIIDEKPCLFLYQEDEIGRTIYYFSSDDSENNIIEIEQFE